MSPTLSSPTCIGDSEKRRNDKSYSNMVLYIFQWYKKTNFTTTAYIAFFTEFRAISHITGKMPMHTLPRRQVPSLLNFIQSHQANPCEHLMRSPTRWPIPLATKPDIMLPKIPIPKIASAINLSGRARSATYPRWSSVMLSESTPPGAASFVIKVFTKLSTIVLSLSNIPHQSGYDTPVAESTDESSTPVRVL